MTKKCKQQDVFHLPLKPKDTATQTEGCRRTDPVSCGNNSLPEVCAFVRKDGICLKPSRSWQKQYDHLRGVS